jgi:drug/metabolite transporter (DMT)-like permease
VARLTPHAIALSSAMCSAVATMLIQRGLKRSNFYAGFWLNVAVGAVGLWSAVVLLVPRDQYNWHAAPYFIASGVVGTAAGRLFRVAAIEKVGASVSSAILNLAPLISTVLAIILLGERITAAILGGTLVVVLGTILLSLSGRDVGFRSRDLLYPFVSAACFGVVAILRKLGLGLAGPLFDSAINITAALIASTAFVLASGNLGALRYDRRSFLYFAAGGAFENSGVFLLIAALGLGEVSVVVPLAGTAPLFVLFLAYWFPSGVERLGWRVITGAVLIVVGVFLLTGWGISRLA